MISIITFASSSKGNMFLLTNEETNILLECGLNEKEIRKNLFNKKLMISDLNACLISHIHQDHSLGVDYVSDYIDTYSTYELADKFEKVKAIQVLKPFKIGTIKILPIPVEHGKTQNNAFVFMDKDSCVFWGTDFSLMQQNVSNFKFDRIFIELNYDDDMIKDFVNDEESENHKKYIRQISTHMSKENCKEHLRHMNLSNCKEIILLHASSFLLSKNNIKKEFEQEFKIKTNFGKEK